MHSSVQRPPLRTPRIGDIVRLSGPGSLGRSFKNTHGVGIVTKIDTPPDRRVEYEVKWLKSEERMRFNEEDLIVVSDVDR
jgi:ethanolamine utilization protein EutP (predicted NTPase)